MYIENTSYMTHTYTHKERENAKIKLFKLLYYLYVIIFLEKTYAVIIYFGEIKDYLRNA